MRKVIVSFILSVIFIFVVLSSIIGLSILIITYSKIVLILVCIIIICGALNYSIGEYFYEKWFE